MKAETRSPRLRAHIWGLLTAAGVVACSATVLGFLGRLWWFLDLFSHFRVQYVFGLSVLGAAFLLARRRKTGVVFVGAACINVIAREEKLPAGDFRPSQYPSQDPSDPGSEGGKEMDKGLGNW